MQRITCTASRSQCCRKGERIQNVCKNEPRPHFLVQKHCDNACRHIHGARRVMRTLCTHVICSNAHLVLVRLGFFPLQLCFSVQSTNLDVELQQGCGARKYEQQQHAHGTARIINVFTWYAIMNEYLSI